MRIQVRLTARADKMGEGAIVSALRENSDEIACRIRDNAAPYHRAQTIMDATSLGKRWPRI